MNVFMHYRYNKSYMPTPLCLYMGHVSDVHVGDVTSGITKKLFWALQWIWLIKSDLYQMFMTFRIQIYSGITHGIVLNGELYTQK